MKLKKASFSVAAIASFFVAVMFVAVSAFTFVGCGKDGKEGSQSGDLTPSGKTDQTTQDGKTPSGGQSTTPDSSSTTVPTGLTYTKMNDNTLVAITGYTGTATSISIPASIDGIPVKIINANSLKDNTTLTNITIPSSVTFIGAQAFNYNKIEGLVFTDKKNWKTTQEYHQGGSEEVNVPEASLSTAQSAANYYKDTNFYRYLHSWSKVSS